MKKYEPGKMVETGQGKGGTRHMVTISTWGPKSDIHLYKKPRHSHYVCMNCRLRGIDKQPSDKGDFAKDTPQAMIEHLLDHREAGDNIPQDAINRLKKDIWNNN